MLRRATIENWKSLLPTPTLPHHLRAHYQGPDWIHRYSDKIMSPDQAIHMFIRSDSRLYLSSNVGVPQLLVSALTSSSAPLKNVHVVQLAAWSSTDYSAPELSGHLRVNAFFLNGRVRKAFREGRADFTPRHVPFPPESDLSSSDTLVWIQVTMGTTSASDT